MAARDDSVIRGSLIACMILLVLSLALNYFFWALADTQTQLADRNKTQLQNAQGEIRTMTDQIITYKKMLGSGVMSEEEFGRLATSESGDVEMDTISAQFVKDMAVLGPNVEPQDRNYPALPEVFVSTLRSRDELYSVARSEAQTIQSKADSDVRNARQAQKVAETDRDGANKKLEEERGLFAQDRARMTQDNETTRDSLTKTSRQLQTVMKKSTEEKTKLVQKTQQLGNTIETQRQKLNQLRNDKFESVQGRVRYVMHGGNVCTINLGSGDALRPGVTFGVISADETRLQDAKVKATLQVTKIRGLHLAEARVVARPDIGTPIIENDLIYSPFWAPGRKVRIALAGDIDIDGDKRPDNEAIKGMIIAAGAEVAASINSAGVVEGTLDANIRFLVIGESPDLDAGTLASQEQAAKAAKAMGLARQKATELGLTIIPAWKLQAYLKTIDDTVTTPLGSAVRGEDFPPNRSPESRSRLPTTLPNMFRTDKSGMQEGNKILAP